MTPMNEWPDVKYRCGNKFSRNRSPGDDIAQVPKATLPTSERDPYSWDSMSAKGLESGSSCPPCRRLTTELQD